MLLPTADAHPENRKKNKNWETQENIKLDGGRINVRNGQHTWGSAMTGFFYGNCHSDWVAKSPVNLCEAVKKPKSK